jgi:hypothetical protein
MTEQEGHRLERGLLRDVFAPLSDVVRRLGDQGFDRVASAGSRVQHLLETLDGLLQFADAFGAPSVLRLGCEDAQSRRRGDEVHELEVGLRANRANESAGEALVEPDRANETGRAWRNASDFFQQGGERRPEIAPT